MKKLKHIFEYIIFLLFTHTLRLFSLDNSASVCACLLRNIGPYLKVSKIARKNLIKIYGTNIDVDKTIDDLWDNFGRYIGEFPFINVLSNQEFDKRVTIKNLENIKAYQKNQQPYLLCLAHQANWDFVIRKINFLYPKFSIIYRKANNPYFDQKILQERITSTGISMIAKGTIGSKDIINAIKTKASIAMLIDQKMNDGIEVPFFDLPAMTAPAIARLHLKYKYPIIPAQIVRKGKTSNFEIILHPPLQYSPTNDIDQDCYNIMLQINKMLEDWIRQYPGQWFWFHNRWKD